MDRGLWANLAGNRQQRHLDGVDTGTLDREERARLRLERFGFVFQFHFLLPEFSALENVLLPIRRLALLSPAAAETRN